MKAQCIAALGQALGREPTEAEVRNVEARLARSMRQEAARDPQAWLAKTAQDQVQAGVQRAHADILGEAQLKQRRQVLQVLATAKLQQQVAAFPGTPFDALSHMIAFHAERKGSVLSVESQAKAIHADGMRQLLDLLHASSPKFFGIIENPAGVRDLVRELHGQASGNADAAAAAKSFKAVTEAMRTRFNDAGGDIGHLDDWGMPHHHSQYLVNKAGREQWKNDVMPLLDRSRYVDEFGARMSDTEVRGFLDSAWETIASGGANKIEPGKFTGNGMRANRGNANREIHFKDGDAFLDYQAKYGERTPYEVMVGHIHRLATDISLIETFGPNPDAQYRLLRDQALKQESAPDPTGANPSGPGKAINRALRVDAMFNMVSGKSPPAANPALARFFDGLRNVMVSSKLGSAVLSSFADEGTMRVAAHVNNMSQMQLMANELRAFNKFDAQETRLANRAGLALNSLAGELNRFANEGVLGNGWDKQLGRLANMTLRLSGLNAMTEARRRAFGVTMMSAIGHEVRERATLGDLDAHDNRMLLSKGITPENWEVWRKAVLEDWGGGNDTMLTPDAIYRIPDADLAALGDPTTLRREAATRLLGAVLEETDVAVVEPGIREKSFMREQIPRGSLKGELMRSFFLFKSFPLSMITRHWMRALSEPTTGGRAGYAAAMVASTTVLGMVALQAAQLTQGKDPRSMRDWRSWTQALIRGGAFSIFGDFVFQDETEGGQSFISTLMGPVAGLVEDTYKLTIANAHQAAQGKDTHIGAEAVRFVKNNTPGANLWYTRAAVDHLIFHQLQEYLSPGYLGRMQRRSEKDYGQSFWWEPGEFVPERAPDMKAAVEEK